MSANLSPTLYPDTWRTSPQSCDLKAVDLRQQVEALVRDIFEGHEEFLGWTPD